MAQSSFTDWSRILTRVSVGLAGFWIALVIALGALAYWSWVQDKKAPIATDEPATLLLTIPDLGQQAVPENAPVEHIGSAT